MTRQAAHCVLKFVRSGSHLDDACACQPAIDRVDKRQGPVFLLDLELHNTPASKAGKVGILLRGMEARCWCAED